MYVTFADGNMMKRKVILKVVLHQEQSGRTFQKILNAHCNVGKDQFSEVE